MSSPGPHFDKAYQYAKQIVAGEIPASKWTKLACKRQLNDLKRKFHPESWPFVFDVKRAERICTFIERLHHIKGEWAKQTIKLEPWQCFYLTTKYGWVYRDTGFRRYRTFYLEVPRKNAKSTIHSGEMLYMATADKEGGAECYSAATSKDQARIVFDVAAKMAKQNLDLRDRYSIVVKAHEIVVGDTDSICKAVSAEAGNLDGLNVHFGGIDELHAHKTRAVYDVIETGAGARSQSMISIITTAGTDITGICYELHEYLQKILGGIFKDESFGGIIYTIDAEDSEKDNWCSETVLRKANPNYGISVKKEYLTNLANKARRSPASRNNFKTKHLDFWCRTNVEWMDMDKWRKCGGAIPALEEFRGEDCWIGLDLASKIDVAALVALFKRDSVWYPFCRFYLPEEAVDDKAATTLSFYKGWADEGLFTLTPGNVIDYDRIETDIKELCGMFNVLSVGFDPWQAGQLSTHLLADNIPMVEVPARVSNFSEPMKQLQSLVYALKLAHGDNPVLTWMISNVVAHYDKKDNIYPNKEKPDNKIDGVIALIIALARAILHSDDSGSVYDTRGIITA